jgi:HEAT repeat protein
VKLATGAFLVLLAVPAYPQDDKVHLEAIRRFQEEFGRAGAGDDEKIGALKDLAQFKSERTAKTLAYSLTHGSVKVRMATARELGAFSGINGVPDTLVVALRSYEGGGKKTNGIRILALQSLGKLKAKEVAPEVDKLIADKDTWIQKAAIDAAGQIRAKSSIDPLIRALRRVEGSDGNGEISVNPLQDELPPVTIPGIIKGAVLQQARPTSERDVLAEPLVGALKSITRTTCTSAKEWESWWSKNKSTFKIPE